MAFPLTDHTEYYILNLLHKILLIIIHKIMNKASLVDILLCTYLTLAIQQRENM